MYKKLRVKAVSLSYDTITHSIMYTKVQGSSFYSF